MSENDAQLELKKRARRRLVGAIALAALAAIVLPMVMDQAPKQPVQDIQIRIPAQDAGAFTSRILPVKPGATPTPLPSTAGPELKASESAKQTASQAKLEPKPETKAEPKMEQKTASASVKAEAKPAAAAGKSPEPGRLPADDKSPAKRPEEAAKTKLVPGGDDGEQWVVQLGAYRDQANVRNLTAKLKQQGYNFYTEALPSPEGNSKTRVRAGPFPNKEAAEKARDRIKRIGVDGIVAQK
ncbi:MAG: SPOR domain-containing protein [Betaproteobacteria bacterium]|nr:SPOR domain-containing protein [Betaproteobacteria bacterium]